MFPNFLITLVIAILPYTTSARHKPIKPNKLQYQNSRLFELSNNRNGSEHIRVKIYGVFDEGASLLPVRLYPYIQCGRAALRPVDLVRPLYFSNQKLYSRLVGPPHKHFPRGVLRVCALQNVRMDDRSLFISFNMEKGPALCDDVQVMDLIYKISELCD